MSKNVLIIEDSPIVLRILEAVFQAQGCAVTTALSGEEGVAKARSEKPDVAIVDTLLPGIDGFETCRQLKQSALGPTPKVIMMTGSVDAVDAGKAWEAGSDGYCVKTADWESLLKEFNKLV